MARLDEIGEVPLPPYIEAARKREAAGAAARRDDDRAALPDGLRSGAGRGRGADGRAALHAGAARGLVAAGHELARLTLHVGPGTFRPVKTEQPREHVMDEERYEIPAATARAVNAARAERAPGGRRSAPPSCARWRARRATAAAR